ncbi:uncharacterized protein PHALS_00539 [Plasmopara halstedii]|uniref:Uncharacterized protein n=1 Tax=Plasmopara halstedii TaxID=4781 RepID=A0A0N7L3L6_PLAHL|nr:uncharacterized protein PHALS_00539 [Plasmopara halstedii]CEG36219.1 hypothetical protein PHALS_00539 [Plasmopara halstedii]|eukprot:XP_024572588.1 hypothetical protein PHALS_00539 [Plasmopara halstedii]
MANKPKIALETSEAVRSFFVEVFILSCKGSCTTLRATDARKLENLLEILFVKYGMFKNIVKREAMTL